VQLAAPADEYLPAEHATQTDAEVALVVAEAVPAAQKLQDEAPARE